MNFDIDILRTTLGDFALQAIVAGSEVRRLQVEVAQLKAAAEKVNMETPIEPPPSDDAVKTSPSPLAFGP